MFKTKFTETFREIGLKHPIVSAPMARVAGVELAVEVSLAGGLGLIPAGIYNIYYIFVNIIVNFE